MSVEQSWNTILAWLSEHAPRTAAGIRPPADPAARAAIMANSSQPWSDELTRWYALHDGENNPGITFTGVLPAMRLLSLAEMTSTSTMYAEIHGDVDDDGSQAGEYSFEYRPAFVPIGDEGTSVSMFVDLRPGPLHGCVGPFDPTEGAPEEPTWNSVGELLDDLAGALSEGRDCGGWTPQVRDGLLSWDMGDGEDDDAF